MEEAAALVLLTNGAGRIPYPIPSGKGCAKCTRHCPLSQKEYLKTNASSLGTNGRLYSKAEAVKGLLLINDDSRLASELEACKSAVAFADLSKPGSLGLFTEAEVKNLTAVRRLDCTYVGEIVATGGRVDVDTALRTIQSDEFGSALSRLVEYNVGAGQGYEQSTPLELLAELKKRSSITFVDKLQAVYTVAGQTVNVDQEIVLEDERFVSIRASSNVELRDRLSFALASLVTEEPVVQRPLADSIFRLLASRSPKDMERYLKGRGIPWEFDGGSKTEYWEDNSMEPDIDQHEVEVNDRVAKMLSESLVPRSPQGSGEHMGKDRFRYRPPTECEPK